MDIEYLLFLQGLRADAPVLLHQALLFLSELVVSNFIVVYIAFVYWCLNKRAGQYLLLCNVGATMVNQLVKNTACIYRPWVRDARVQVSADAAATATGYSFPSGHTTLAMSTYGGTAVWQHRRRWLAALMVALALLTGFARNWLGAHTPQDVVVALLLSGGFLFIAAKAMAWVDTHPGNDTRILAAGVILCLLALAYVEFKPYPLDYLADGSLLVDPYKMKTDCYKAFGAALGFLLGWYVERRWVNFDTAVSWPVRLARLAGGCVLLLAVEKIGNRLAVTLLGTNLGLFAARTLLLLLAVGVYPALFIAWEKRIAPTHSCSAEAPEQKR